MRHARFTMFNLINNCLVGTARSLDGAIQNKWPGMDEEDLTEEETAEIDKNIFCCEECSFWYYTENMSKQDQICEDCED